MEEITYIQAEIKEEKIPLTLYIINGAFLYVRLHVRVIMLGEYIGTT